MKKLIGLFLFISQSLFAQKEQSVDQYIFKYETGKTYTPLSSAKNMTADIPWAEVVVSFPVGFNFEIGGKTANRFIYYGNELEGFALGSDTVGVVNRFMAFGDAACDRSSSHDPRSAESPIRYQIDGVRPNRIIKVEMFNAGFFYDCVFPKEMIKDSMNVQFWIYETSNIIEIRYGDHKRANPSIHSSGITPLVGYIKEDTVVYKKGSSGFSKGYYLKGNPNSPVVDSFYKMDYGMTGLDFFPPSGTVYRFIPKAVASSIGEVNISAQFKVYPTLVNNVLTVEQKSAKKIIVQIADANGKFINSPLTLINSKNNIDVSALASGVYMLQLSNEDGNAVYKFVKQ